jgi:pimeloyl-ACP methyl ester carboxylesterase
MHIITDTAQCQQRSDTLLVLLPGAYDKPEDFVAQGFVKAVRDRQLDVDVQMVNAHLGYYKEITVIERLHEDVIKPAQAQGYRHIWLAGISLGGFGSLIYSKAHTDTVKGMFVMAPFLGTRDVHTEIRAAGGMAAWQPGDIKPDDYDRKLWQWLQGYAQGRHAPSLYLGYGVSDRFADSNSLLATALPKAQVLTTEGGHDWAPWQRLWAQFLDLNTFGKLAAAKTACAK